MLIMKCDLYTVENVQNIRDLGGYPVADGQMTVKKRFIRSASLADLTETGREQLRDIGIDCVIDLRSVYETEKSPDSIIGYPGIHYESIPMLDNIVSNSAQGDFTKYPASMSEMYIGLLRDSTDEIKKLFGVFAASHGTILFH
ncbi:MAG: tyrosine-protein phosphatase, partial [Oscillospiraceae bacterium]|nr:tyrosine-protein phosphatase [Oscillospiraceae bacterium]